MTAHPELKLARWAARELDADAAPSDDDEHELRAVRDVRERDRPRSGLGRVVFALLGEQLAALKPAGAVAPEGLQAVYEGPALHAEVRVPVAGDDD